MMQWKRFPKESDWMEEPLGYFNEIGVLKNFHPVNSQAQVNAMVRTLSRLVPFPLFLK
jgi:hypothetical protein